MNMITMYKADRTKQVPENDVKGQIGNGWAVEINEGADKPVKATLRPVKKNAEDTPAVAEITSAEQGGDDKANLKGETNE